MLNLKVGFTQEMTVDPVDALGHQCSGDISVKVGNPDVLELAVDFLADNQIKFVLTGKKPGRTRLTVSTPGYRKIKYFQVVD